MGNSYIPFTGLAVAIIMLSMYVENNKLYINILRERCSINAMQIDSLREINQRLLTKDKKHYGTTTPN